MSRVSLTISQPGRLEMLGGKFLIHLFRRYVFSLTSKCSCAFCWLFPAGVWTVRFQCSGENSKHMSAHQYIAVLQALIWEYKIGTECPHIIQRCKYQQAVRRKGRFGQQPWSVLKEFWRLQQIKEFLARNEENVLFHWVYKGLVVHFELVQVKIFSSLSKIHPQKPFQLSSPLWCWIRHCSARTALHTCMNSPTSNLTLLSSVTCTMRSSFKIASWGSACSHHQGKITLSSTMQMNSKGTVVSCFHKHSDLYWS